MLYTLWSHLNVIKRLDVGGIVAQLLKHEEIPRTITTKYYWSDIDYTTNVRSKEDTTPVGSFKNFKHTHKITHLWLQNLQCKQAIALSEVMQTNINALYCSLWYHANAAKDCFRVVGGKL